MDQFEKIQSQWKLAFEKMTRSPGFSRLLTAEISVEHYKAILREIYFHARENPQIQALATVYFRGQQRQMVKPFYQHAVSEIGHDQLALNDLEALGEDVSNIPTERPLPATTALLSYAFYQIQYHNPVGYLGYLFHLEFMPTSDGEKYMTALAKIGVPESAMTFIKDHATIDVGHNRLMKNYIKELVKTPVELESVIYAIKVTAELYGNMITAAVQSADAKQDLTASTIIHRDDRELAFSPSV